MAPGSAPGVLSRNILFKATNGSNVKVGNGGNRTAPGASNVKLEYNTTYNANHQFLIFSTLSGIALKGNSMIRSTGRTPVGIYFNDLSQAHAATAAHDYGYLMGHNVWAPNSPASTYAEGDGSRRTATATRSPGDDTSLARVVITISRQMSKCGLTNEGTSFARDETMLRHNASFLFRSILLTSAVGASAVGTACGGAVDAGTGSRGTKTTDTGGTRGGSTSGDVVDASSGGTSGMSSTSSSTSSGGSTSSSTRPRSSSSRSRTRPKAASVRRSAPS
jgi:hypothetical protein